MYAAMLTRKNSNTVRQSDAIGVEFAAGNTVRRPRLRTQRLTPIGKRCACLSNTVLLSRNAFIRCAPPGVDRVDCCEPGSSCDARY